MSSKVYEMEESSRREVVLYNKTLGGAIEIIDLLRTELKKRDELQEIKDDIKEIKILLEEQMGYNDK